MSRSSRSADARVETIGFTSTPYPAAVRAAILGVSNCPTHTAEISRLNFQLAELYARAVRGPRSGASDRCELIGCHGQTIFHEGRSNTLQIGEPAVLAERTGVPVVSNFRARDIAAGGQGAPLVPFVDYLLFRHRRRTRVALNIGGIANITVIPAGCAPEDVVAFDTGPGNMVIDALAHEFSQRQTKVRSGGQDRRIGKRKPCVAAMSLLARRLLPPQAAKERRPRAIRSGVYRAAAEVWSALRDLMATATVLTAATIADRRAAHRAGTSRPDRERRRHSQSADHGRTSPAFCPGSIFPRPPITASTPMPRKPSPSLSWRTKPGAASRPTCLRLLAPNELSYWAILRPESAR